MSGTAPIRAATAPKGVTPPSGGGSSRVLSDVIVELGFATRDAVEEAVRAARSPGTTVARVLVDTGAITEEQLARATAERYDMDYIDLDGFTVDPSAANLIKPSAARRYQAVPVAYLGSGLLVAVADPADTLGVEDVAVMTKLEVRPAVAARPALDALLEALPLDELGYTPDKTDQEPDHEPAHEPDDEADHELGDEAAAPTPDEPGDEAAAATPDTTGEAAGLRDELDALKAQLAAAEGQLKGESKRGEAGEMLELRARLAESEAELAGAETELEEARVRLREAKEVGAELETLREQLAGAQTGLDQASARARDGEALAAEAEELHGKIGELKQQRDELRSELRRVGADADVRNSELESLRTKLTDAETELVRVRAESDARGSELEAMGTRTESAEREAEEAVRRASEFEQQADEARRRQSELEREAGEARRLGEELEAAEARAESARQGLSELRQEREQDREQAAMVERDLREALGEEERRRGELEGRMRSALRALAEPDAQDEPEES